MWVQMTVNTVLFDSKNNSYIVVLKDETGKKLSADLDRRV